MNIITLIPEVRCRDNFVIRDQQILDIIRSVGPDETFCNFLDESTDLIHHLSSDPDLHQSGFLHLVTETVFDYPHNWTSEKTWKPIVHLRPFVIAGPPGSLAHLRSLGFKTFSTWWDESYDEIQDPLLRMKSIIELLKKICRHTLEDLIEIYNEMELTLKFNYDHYYGSFVNDSLDEFNKKCQENLLPR